MTARLDVLAEGYADDRVASTVVLVRDGDAVIVVDPGMVASRSLILDPLAALGVDPGQVTDVVFSHHHPDHTLNAALFTEARFHDHWAIYQDDVWIDREADGFELGPSVRLKATPGHSAEDITTLVETDSGLVACTHLWWSADGPDIDPLADDQADARGLPGRAAGPPARRWWCRATGARSARRDVGAAGLPRRQGDDDLGQPAQFLGGVVVVGRGPHHGGGPVATQVEAGGRPVGHRDVHPHRPGRGRHLGRGVARRR